MRRLGARPRPDRAGGHRAAAKVAGQARRQAALYGLPDPGLLTSVTAQTLPSGVSQRAQWGLLLGAEAGLAGLGWAGPPAG